MASLGKLAGSLCEFVSPVSEDLLCKKCNIVARKLSATTCCGESYCYQCIADISQQGGPCQECGIQEFKYFEQTKYQKRINNLEIYCSMKERGCVWSGTLDQLDTHLDPRLDNCQYVDTKCPLSCLQSIPKNEVKQHVAHECPNRPHVCQHCGYNATYEEVVDKHIPECKYVPLQCPNLCGVSCDREDMEDHMKICLKEEVQCTFKGVECKEKFQREYEETHVEENLSRHLSLTAAQSVRTKEVLQKQAQRIESLVREKESIKKELTEKIVLLEKKFDKFFNVFLSFEQFRSFEMNNFSSKSKESKFLWKSPVMCAQMGVKFIISFQMCKFGDLFRYANPDDGEDVGGRRAAGGVGAGIDAGTLIGVAVGGVGAAVGGVGGVGAVIGAAAAIAFASTKYIYANAHAVRSEYDDDLKWPVQVEIILEIVQENKQYIISTRWNKPDQNYCEDFYTPLNLQLGTVSQLKKLCINDALYFRVVNINFKD